MIYDTYNYKNGKNKSCDASTFNETHIFRSQYSFLIYTGKRQDQSSWKHKIQWTKRMCVNW